MSELAAAETILPCASHIEEMEHVRGRGGHALGL